jgi:hypothetical protein
MLPSLLLCFALGPLQIDAKIHELEEKLLSAGVDVRPLTQASDAKAEYAAIANELRRLKGRSGEWQRIFLSLEAAAQKPAARFIRTQRADKPIDRLNEGVIEPIDEWCQAHATYWAKKGDWGAVERLYRFEQRFKEQLCAANSNTFGMWLPDDGNPPLGYLSIEGPDARRWLRRKLETFDLKGLLLARLSGFGRLAREAKGHGIALHNVSSFVVGPEPKPVPKWKEQSESDPLFRQKADLATLQQLNVLAKEALRMPVKQAVSKHLGQRLWELLHAEGSNSARWAADHLDVYSGSLFSTYGWHTILIELDLREARDAGRRLVPTWSKHYCVDPDTGRPIVVRATRKSIWMSSKSEFGEWHSSDPW